MKTYLTLLILVAIVAALLVSSATPARSAMQATGQVMVASGGHYHLAQTPDRNAANIISGGSYRLQGPSYPALTGNGCCCTFLPCVRR